MKKSLLSIFGALAVSAVVAQTPSPSWTISQNAGFPNPSTGIKFMDAVTPNVVWVTGYDGVTPGLNYNWVSVTSDGGNTWTAGNVFADTVSYVLANLEGIDANTAWVSAYDYNLQAQGGIFRTTNGGSTWTNMTAVGMYTNTNAFTDIVAFLTSSVGITMGDPVNGDFEIWRTTDGGTTWAQIPGASIPNPLVGEYGLVNVYCKQGTSNIWFGTNKGRIYRSTDGGLTWNVSAVAASSSSINDISFVDANNGVAFAYTSASVFQMYNTTNGGATWTAITNISPNVGKNDISAVPGTNIYVSAGAGTGNTILSYSGDNGVTWVDYGSSGIQYLVVDFADASNGWAGSFSDPGTASIGGIFKYNGATITNAVNASFNSLSITCPNTAITTTNTSFGATSYSWSVVPSGTLSSATATNPSITFGSAGTYTVILMASNSSTSSTFSKVITVSTCNSLSDNSSVAAGMVTYPNPAKDVLNLEVLNADGYSVSLTNILGKVIFTDKIEKDKTTINLNNITAGIYFLTVDVKGQKATRKIIVE